MSLSKHAAALAAELADDQHVAMVAIPTAALAAQLGMTVDEWTALREGELLSVGAAIHELRNAGWRLRVEHVPDARHLHDGCERIIVVLAEEMPTG